VARVFLIRHVEVELRDGVPPEEWLPTAAGLEAARRLAGEPFVSELALVATSPEPKAVATAEPLAAAAGVPLRVEHDLREVRRTHQRVVPRETYVDLVGRYLAGERIEDWESREAAAARFSAVVERLAAEAEGPLAVVTHGLVLSLRLGYGLEDWSALRLPDVVETDV
jgi:broad specificity phosphatase PhoE